nr:hypothetical protein [Tanacetum cinerariifolium]
MNGWVDDDEDVDIEEDEDAEIIFPYEVQGDQTPPSRDKSFDSEFEAEEADDELEIKEADVKPEVEEAGDEPEAEGADVELKAEEPDGAPKATIGTGSQSLFAVRDFPMGFYEAGESSTTRDPQFVGGSGGNGGNANGTGVKGARPTVPELIGCTYATFIKCDPLPFNGTEGIV